MISRMSTALMLGIAWGFSVILMKFVAQTGIEIFQAIFFATLGVVIVLLGYLKLQNRSFLYHRRFLIFGLVCAITAYLIPEYLSIAVLRHINAGVLSIVLTTVPIFTYLIALVVREDEFHRRKLLGLVVAFCAVFLLITSRNSFSTLQINLWLSLSFVIAISYAIYDVYASKAWPENYDSLEVAYGESLFVLVLILPLLVLNFDFKETVETWRSGYWFIILLALLWSIERILYFEAIKKGGAVYAAQASYLAPPVSIVLGMFFFNEPFDITLWLCFVIILASVMMISSVPKKSGKLNKSGLDEQAVL